MDVLENTSAMKSARGYLTQLPPELLHNIFSFLFPTHAPDRAVYDNKKEKKCSHELDKVAATCKLLRAEVSEWALHFLISHNNITKFKLPKSAAKKSGTVNHLRGRKGLLTWSSNHCIFCGTKSGRSAILANGFRCCSACDKARWEKITLTDAKKIYGLKEENLLPNKHVNSPTSRKLVAQLGLPRARYGVYFCQGAKATMFLLADVKVLAALVHHGQLEPYLAKREAARVARSTKAENKKQSGSLSKGNASKSSFVRGPRSDEDMSGSEFGGADELAGIEGLRDAWRRSTVEFVEDEEPDLVFIDG